MPTKTTWQVFARVEKSGRYAEYDDIATIYSPKGVPAAKDVLAAQLTAIVQAYPHLRGGQATGTATRIN